MDVNSPQLPAKSIEASINYGTKNLAVVVRIVTGRETRAELDAIPLLPLNLFPGQRDTPQKVAWNDKGNLIWGHDINYAIDTKVIKRENVISYFKLCLYPDFKDSPIARENNAKLASYGKTKLDLLTEHLAGIMAASKAAMKADHHLGTQYGSKIDNMVFSMFLSVPQMWNPPANWWMTTAAEQAGIAHTILVREPQCAAAHVVWGWERESQLQGGDVFLLADPGGGTADFVSYAVVLDASKQVSLRVVGSPEGGLCGSQHINEAFLAWLKAEARTSGDPSHPLYPNDSNFADWCKKANTAESAVLAQADDQFERAKIAFRHTGIDGGITLSSADHKLHWRVEIPSALMEKFFHQIFTKIFAHMNAQIYPRTTTIIMAGGLAASQYFMDEVRQRFAKYNIVGGGSDGSIHESHTVCLGALRRHNRVDTSAVPAADLFGIGELKEYNPADHPEVMYPTRGGWRRNNLMIQMGIDGMVDYVTDRWVPILGSGLPRVQGSTQTATMWHECWANQGEQGILEMPIYWIQDASHFSEGDAIYKPIASRDAKKLHCDGVYDWGLPLTAQLPDFKSMGFELITVPDEKLKEEYRSSSRGKKKSEAKGYVYFLRYRVVSVGANVSVDVHMAMPGKYDNGIANPDAMISESDLVLLVSSSLLGEKFDPNPQE